MVPPSPRKPEGEQLIHPTAERQSDCCSAWRLLSLLSAALARSTASFISLSEGISLPPRSASLYDGFFSSTIFSLIPREISSISPSAWPTSSFAWLFGSMRVRVDRAVGAFVRTRWPLSVYFCPDLQSTGVRINPHCSFYSRLRRGIGVFGLGFYVRGTVAWRYAEKILHVRQGFIYDGFCVFRFHDNSFQCQ